MNKAAVQYIQLVYLYRLILVRYYFLFNLVSLLAENEEEQDPSLEKTAAGETPLKGNGVISAEAYRCNFFYHGDHLGSSNYITDRSGRVFEHTIYLPYGETWIDEGHETSLLGYKFTGKELDEETGLYYFGARYYDPQVSVWISTDLGMDRYLPTDSQLFFPDQAFNATSLKGAGGVYNSKNINLYHYAGLNPMKFVDPTGLWVDNGDGTFTAVKGDTIWGLNQETGTNFKYDGDPTKLQVGETVNLGAQNKSNDYGTVNTTGEAWDHYKKGNGEPMNIGDATKKELMTDLTQEWKAFKLKKGWSNGDSGNYGVNLTLSTFHVGNTRVDYKSTCGTTTCVTNFTGFAGDGFWDAKEYTPWNHDNKGPGSEFKGGTVYEYVPFNWSISYPRPK